MCERDRGDGHLEKNLRLCLFLSHPVSDERPQHVPLDFLVWAEALSSILFRDARQCVSFVGYPLERQELTP